MSQTLDERIRERIRRDGPLPFVDFMRLALYDPEGGYYTSSRQRIGPEGDFYTAPTTHPGFGALLALHLERMWHLLDEPARFTVLEGGGGKGLLAADALRYSRHLTPVFCAALDYWVLEQERRGHARLSEDGTHVEIAWEPTTDLPSFSVGCFLSNELFDAFPRHRVAMQGGQLSELYVDLSGDSFIEVVGAPSTARLADYFRWVDVQLAEGCKAEVDLEGPLFLRRIARSLGRGFILTIDYGYTAQDLYSPRRRQGTLLCYYKHTSSPSPYIRIGRQDITAHVDFTALGKAGEEEGLRVEGLMTQQRYVKRLGIQSFLDGLRALDLPPPALMANRMALLDLTRPEGFGQFGVLLHSKGLDPQPPADELFTTRLRGGLGDLPVPLLTPEHMPLLQGRYAHYAQPFTLT